MADSFTTSTSSSTRKSSRIAKRFKATPSTSSYTIDPTGNPAPVVAAKTNPKQQATTTKTTRTKSKDNDVKHHATGAAGGNSNLPPLEDENILHHIFSYVGDFQYLFIGSVNSKFEKSYVALFPRKTTHFNASTIEITKFCWDEINKCKDDDEKNDKMKRMLWHSAARYGKIDIVKYLLELLPPIQKNISFKKVSYKDRKKMDWKYDLCFTAAKYGQMELLQWACDENICVAKDDDMVCHNAIAYGHIDMFQWAIKNGFCFDDAEQAAFEASRQGQIEALKLLHDEYDIIRPVYRDESCGCCNSAAACGQVDVLKWINENYDAGWNGDTLNFAVSGGHMSTVQYLLENECGWRSDAYSIAAYYGHLAILQLLRSSDPNWDEGDESSVTAQAAGGGHLEIIEWAVENGWPLTASACQYAAGFGQLDALKWLRARDCPWDSDTTKYASTDEIYKWAKKNGCPVAKGNPREKLNNYYDWLR